jgi:succinyl-CoA synthetase beta subunit
MNVAQYAAEHACELEELDINPLIVTKTGAFAADALIRTRGAAPSLEPN